MLGGNSFNNRPLSVAKASLDPIQETQTEACAEHRQRPNVGNAQQLTLQNRPQQHRLALAKVPVAYGPQHCGDGGGEVEQRRRGLCCARGGEEEAARAGGDGERNGAAAAFAAVVDGADAKWVLVRSIVTAAFAFRLKSRQPSDSRICAAVAKANAAERQRLCGPLHR